MYRPLAMMLSAIGLIALTTGLRAADDQPRDILARAIKAHGGEELMTKYKAAQSKNKGKINIPGAGEIEFTQETAYVLPDKFKEVLEMKVGGQNLNVLSLINGDKIVLEVNGKAIDAEDKIKAAMKDVGHVIKVARLTPLVREKGFELSLIGEDKVEGKPVIGIRVVSKGQKDVNLYFDKKTNLLTKVEHRTNEPFNGNEVSEERIVLEYGKNKDGVPVPKRVAVRHDGKTFIEVEVLEMQFLEKIDESEFKK